MDVAIVVAGDETSLSDGVIARLDAWDGLGLNVITRLSSQGPQQRGDSDRGFRVQPRFVTLVFKVVGGDEADLEGRRKALLRLVRATGLGATLLFTKESMVPNPDPSGAEGDVREEKYLDVEFVSHEVSGRFARRKEVVGVVFKASEPDFYKLPGFAVTFGQSGGSGGFTVPMPVPHEVGGSTLGETRLITYTGSAPTFPAIRITGPITDALIEQLTTGEQIFLDGITIDAGEWVDIDLRYGFKRVLDQAGVYVQVSEDSDLATFHLAADPEAAGGVNELMLSGSGTDGGTRADVSWVERDEEL